MSFQVPSYPGQPVATMAVTAWHRGRCRLIVSVASELSAWAFKPPDGNNSSAFRPAVGGAGLLRHGRGQALRP